MLTENERYIGMHGGDDGHAGGHHLLDHERCSFRITVVAGDAWRHKYVRGERDLNQLVERHERVMTHDIVHVESVDLAEYRFLRRQVTALAADVPDERQMQVDA